MKQWNQKLNENAARYEADKSTANAIKLLEDANTKTQIRYAFHLIIRKSLGTDLFPKHYFVSKKNELLLELIDLQRNPDGIENKLRIVKNIDYPKMGFSSHKIVGGLSEYFGHPIVAEVGKSTNGDWFCQISSGSFVYSTEHGTSAEEAANRALASSPADHLRLGMEILTEGEEVV